MSTRKISKYEIKYRELLSSSMLDNQDHIHQDTVHQFEGPLLVKKRKYMHKYYSLPVGGDLRYKYVEIDDYFINAYLLTLPRHWLTAAGFNQLKSGDQIRVDGWVYDKSTVGLQRPESEIEKAVDVLKIESPYFKLSVVDDVKNGLGKYRQMIRKGTWLALLSFFLIAAGGFIAVLFHELKNSQWWTGLIFVGAGVILFFLMLKIALNAQRILHSIIPSQGLDDEEFS
ncbi:MAG: hypothetical protein OEZ34_08420 [Spirochaetia bacterium]|nr:hypothetical protein [Spirochaetia bacterium]